MTHLWSKPQMKWKGFGPTAYSLSLEKLFCGERRTNFPFARRSPSGQFGSR
jgi:hypothetical protein